MIKTLGGLLEMSILNLNKKNKNKNLFKTIHLHLKKVNCFQRKNKNNPLTN